MRRRHARIIRALATVAALFFGGCTVSGAPPAGDPREFFKGKTMNYIVATSSGGGYDTYGRLVSEYLKKHLGLGRIVVRNVPGGGHIVGANEIYSARPDGLTLGIFNTGIIYAQLDQADGLQADLRRMSWVGKAGGEPRILAVSKQSGFRSIDDMRAAGRPLLFGESGVGNAAYYDTNLLAGALGLRVKFVFGLDTNGAHLSMMRGEIDGHLSSASSSRPFLANGYGYAVLRVGEGDEVDTNIPDASSLVTTEEGRVIADLIRSIAVLSRWTVGPPGIPEDRLAALRDAYMAALNDPALVAAARRLDIPIVPMDGGTLAREVERALIQPPRAMALINAVTSQSAR